jgi:hypothetical protein
MLGNTSAIGKDVFFNQKVWAQLQVGADNEFVIVLEGRAQSALSGWF